MQGRLLPVVLLVVSALADINPGDIGIQFFGNEYARTQQIPNFPTTDLSLTFRIKASSGHIMNYGKILASGTFDASHLALKSANALVVSRGTGTAWSTGVNFADNQWHALGLTWKMSTGETKLYKDGNLVGTTVLSRGVPLSVNGFLGLGQIQNCPNGCFTDQTGLVGVIADLTLWRKVLTADQISYLSSNSPSGDESDLVSYWPLNQNVGSSGPDKKGGNDIILAGPVFTKDVGMRDATTSLAMNKYGAAIAPPVADLATGDFTVEFWIKTTSTDTSVILSYFVEGATNPYPFVIHSPASVKVVHNSEEMRTDTNLATGEWNHAAFTWQQQTGRLKLILNGAQAYPPAWLPETDYDLMPTLDLGGVLPARPSRVVLGNKLLCAGAAKSCLANGFSFEGQLQEVRMWNIVRTATDISATKDQALVAPFSPNLVVYWKLDELDTSRTATDSAKANTASLNLPMWKNNLIAPPFPTLQEVNDKVGALKAQMAELLDFVKEVLDPEEPSPSVTATANGTGFAIKDESKCDRRYKYQCKFTTRKVATTAPATAPRNAAMMFMQRGPATDPELSELLEPGQHHHQQPLRQLEQLESDSRQDEDAQDPMSSLDLPMFAQQESENALPNLVQTQAPTTVAESWTPSNSQPAVFSVPTERKRHAWATPRDVSSFSHGAVESATNTIATRISEDTEVGAHLRKGRHAWAAGAQRAVTPGRLSGTDGSLSGFLEEEQVTASGRGDAPSVLVQRTQAFHQAKKIVNVDVQDLDDNGPEALGRQRSQQQQPQRPLPQQQQQQPQRVRAPAAPSDSEEPQQQRPRRTPHNEEQEDDLEKAQREFEEEQRRFDNFRDEGESDFPAGWNFDSSSDNNNIDNMAISNIDELMKRDEEMKNESKKAPSTKNSDARSSGNKGRNQAQATIGFAELQSAQSPQQQQPQQQQQQQQPHHHHHHHHHHRHQVASDTASAQTPATTASVAAAAPPAAMPAKAIQAGNPALDASPTNGMPVSRQQLVQSAKAVQQQQDDDNEWPNEADITSADIPDASSAKPTPVAGKDTAAVKTQSKLDNGGMGGKFEQLVMPGSDSEWDSAIAEGVSNSDLADGMSADDVQGATL